MPKSLERRRLIGSLIAAGTSLIVSGCGRRENEKKPGSEEEMVTPSEDLMREHGVLRRILLIYEELDRRDRTGIPDMTALADAAGIIRTFIEDYHEKLEEDYIFPRFKKAGKLVDLVQTLKTQHDAGRAITTYIINIAGSPSTGNRAPGKLGTLIHDFVRMYRPHAAREDTVLFRQFPEVVGREEYEELGEKFEDREHELFGKSGFDGLVDKVAAIETNLGIYDLAQFTPKS